VIQNYYLKVVNAIKELKEDGQGYYFKGTIVITTIDRPLRRPLVPFHQI
jgi:hypothetical protein